MKAMFTMAAVRGYIQSQITDYEQKAIETLQYAGEEFVAKAKSKLPKNLKTRNPKDGRFNDRTGNLSSSIGYIILKDGRPIESLFEGEQSEGVTQGRKAAEEVAEKFPNGLVLIGVAGMDYAAAVESQGFDVITGSAPKSKDIKDLLRSIKIGR